MVKYNLLKYSYNLSLKKLVIAALSFLVIKFTILIDLPFGIN